MMSTKFQAGWHIINKDIKERKEHPTDPWGTPAATAFQEESFLPSLTLNPDCFWSKNSREFKYTVN
jgi:hypothetical protein